MSPGQSGESGTHRIFIAIALPESVKDKIERAQEHLRRALPGKSVRWARPNQLHLTLKFLGNVESPHLDALTTSVRAACAGCGALRLGAGQIGFFPSARRPRVVWTRVWDEGGHLSSLHRAVEGAVAAFTSEAPEPEFTAHVTLGRCPTIRRSEAEMLARLAKEMENTVFGEWTAHHVDIVRSQLSPGGSRYTTLASIPLGPG